MGIDHTQRVRLSFSFSQIFYQLIVKIPTCTDQAIGGVVGKLIGGIVFIDQGRQADGFVVLVANALTFGVLAAAG
jgi:hypothetical protein